MKENKFKAPKETADNYKIVANIGGKDVEFVSKQKTKGKEMQMIILIYVACALTMFGAIYIYSKKEDTAFSETLNKYQSLQVELKSATDSINAQRTTIMLQADKIKKFEETIDKFCEEIKKQKIEIDNLQEHCAKIREQQIELKDKVSSKRPVLKLNQPIEVRFATNSFDQELVKKVKKQMKAVSQ